jgi:hypothetical protein
MAALQKLQRWKNLLDPEKNYKAPRSKKSPAALENPSLFDSY